MTIGSESVRGLQLLRHAKSDWSADDGADLDRPLSERGRRAAHAMGKWLSGNDIIPDIIYTSPARRARQTLALIGEQVAQPRIEVSEALYHADLTGLLRFLGQVPVEFAQVMLVGHNPGLEELLIYLVAGQAEHDARGKLFPTGAFAHIALPDDWRRLAQNAGRLLTLIRPRELPA